MIQTYSYLLIDRKECVFSDHKTDLLNMNVQHLKKKKKAKIRAAWFARSLQLFATVLLKSELRFQHLKSD